MQKKEKDYVLKISSLILTELCGSVFFIRIIHINYKKMWIILLEKCENMNNTEMLKKNYEFKYIFLKGKYVSGKYIEIYVKKNNLAKNLLGIAISKKIAKSVKRNRIKRLIRENYRLLEKDLKLGYSIIILWKKNISIENANYKNIEFDLKNIFKKINIINIEEGI